MGECEDQSRLDASMGLSGSKGGPGTFQENERFYGVHIPNSCEEDFLHVYDNKEEALRVVKNHKKARFKAFKLRSDAVTFAVHGPENVTPEESSLATPGASQGDAEKPSPFKGPKPHDMLQFRRAIENGNLDIVSKTAWDNPRFLISSGDTPSILQEGSRYNALHIAAKSKNAVMAEFILQTVSNPAFAKLLYGDESAAPGNLGSSAGRSVIFLDLYLNTPDKGMHETPLHFATKFGAAQVVATLVSYSECHRDPKNKFGQRPIDIVCARCPNAGEELKSEIVALLQNDYYVPVLRADDNSVQPIVGTPFSPKEPPVLNEDPLSPRLEIHAFAGPMSQFQANDFRRMWRTPQRAKKNNPPETKDQSTSCPALPIQDPQKGLERIGRDLAADYNVPWKEYWPFLNTFIDLSSLEGLKVLEEYLSERYQSLDDAAPRSDLANDSVELCGGATSCEAIKVNQSLDGTNTEPEILSPVSQLCSMLTACTIMDDSMGSGMGRGSPASLSPSPSPSPSSSPSNGSILSSSSAKFFDWLKRRRPESERNVVENSQNEAILMALSNPSVSPFLYVEKSLQLFAKRIAASLHHLVSGCTTHQLSDSIKDVLKPEVKRIQSLVGSYMEDARFVAVDYHLVHSRIACSVAERLVGQLTWEEREVFYNGLQGLLSAKVHLDGTLSSDDEEVVSSYRQPRSSRQSSGSSQKTAIRCIVGQMIWALDQLEGSGPDGRSPLPPRPQVRTESECLEMWSDAYLCLCSWPSNSQSNFSRGSRKTSSMKRTINSSHGIENSNVSRHLEFEEKHEASFEDGSTQISEDDEVDSFYTPPASLRGSPVPPELHCSSESDCDEEMNVPDEGPLIFLEGSEPTRLDADVLNAISSCSITQSSHPHIYRWRHEVLLHSAEERKRWPARKLEHSSSLSLVDLPSTPTCISTPVASSKLGVCSVPSWSRVTGPYSPSPNKGCEKA